VIFFFEILGGWTEERKQNKQNKQKGMRWIDDLNISVFVCIFFIFISWLIADELTRRSRPEEEGKGEDSLNRFHFYPRLDSTFRGKAARFLPTTPLVVDN
jgi:hypothetical protein